MWRKAPAVAVAATLAAVAGSACGSSEQSTGSPGHTRAADLRIVPASGTEHTSFTFTFTAPRAAGRQGDTRLGYTVAVSGPLRRGCLPARSATVSSASRGSDVSVTLNPAKLGAPWCRGTYAVRVTEIQTPYCSPGTMCPQYVRVVGTVAHGTFRVNGP
jgi:hypothetical protein